MERKIKYYFSLAFGIMSLIAYFKDPQSFDKVVTEVFSFEAIENDTLSINPVQWDGVDVEIDSTILTEVDSLKKVIAMQKKQLQKHQKVTVVRQTVQPNLSKEQQQITAIFKNAREKLGIKSRKDTIKIINSTVKIR